MNEYTSYINIRILMPPNDSKFKNDFLNHLANPYLKLNRSFQETYFILLAKEISGGDFQNLSRWFFIFLSKVNFLNYYRRTFQIQAHEHSIPGRRFASGIDKISVKTKEKAKAIADKKRPI